MIACAYTPGHYAALARECQRVWAARGVTVHAFEYPDGGSWHHNVLGFNVAIAPHWDRMEPLYVIGVDTMPGPRFKGFPELAGADVVCEHRPSRQANMKIHSGVVGWAPSAGDLYDRFIDMLKLEMGIPPYRNDQEVLYGLIKDANWRRLPDGYNCKDLGNPFAEFYHGHASRSQGVYRA